MSSLLCLPVAYYPVRVAKTLRAHKSDVRAELEAVVDDAHGWCPWPAVYVLITVRAEQRTSYRSLLWCLAAIVATCTSDLPAVMRCSYFCAVTHQ